MVEPSETTAECIPPGCEHRDSKGRGLHVKPLQQSTRPKRTRRKSRSELNFECRSYAKKTVQGEEENRGKYKKIYTVVSIPYSHATNGFTRCPSKPTDNALLNLKQLNTHQYANTQNGFTRCPSNLTDNALLNF